MRYNDFLLQIIDLNGWFVSDSWFQLSKDKIPENQNCCSTVTSPSSSSQIVSSQPSWPNCPDHAGITAPRMSAFNVASTPAPLSDELKTIEHQIANSSPSARDTAGAHQYAVPCAVGADGAETIACAITADACTKMNETVEQQLSVRRRSIDSTDDTKKVQGALIVFSSRIIRP